MYRSLVAKIRSEACLDKKPEVKPEDKYEPEFSLEDDDSNDHRGVKEESKDRWVYFTICIVQLKKSGQ